MNVYYLHQSPRTAAGWLDDKDATLCQSYFSHLVSNALQLYTGEKLSHLKRFDSKYWNIHQEWVLDSIEHALWCIDMYVALRQRNNTTEDYLLERMLYHYAQLLPKTEWRNPPLVMPERYSTMDCSDVYKWRCYYASSSRLWRKVKRPFWAR